MSHGTGGVVTFMEEDTRRPYFASHFQLKPVSRPTPPPLIMILVVVFRFYCLARCALASIWVVTPSQRSDPPDYPQIEPNRPTKSNCKNVPKN